jgi:Glycosyltransferase family 87
MIGTGTAAPAGTASTRWRIGWGTPLVLLALAVLVTKFVLDFTGHRIGLGDRLDDGSAHGSVMVDFRDALYLPGHYLWHGNPWDAHAYAAANPQAADFGLYSPANFLIFGPILALPWTLATTGWVLLVEIPMLAVAVGFAWRLLDRPRRLDVVLLLAVAALLWQPMLSVLRLGNPSVVTTIALALAAWPGTSAWVLRGATAAMWLKPHFGLGSIMPGAAGRWRQVAAGFAASVALAIPAAALAAYHAGGVLPLLRSLPANLSNTAGSAYGGNPMLPGRYDSVSLVSRSIGEPLPGFLQALLVVAVFAVGTWTYLRWLRADRPELALATAVLTVLLGIHQNVDDFAAGILVVVALAAAGWRQRRRASWRDPATAAGRVVLVLVVLIGFRLPSMEHAVGLSWLYGRDLDEALAVLSWLVCVGAAALNRPRPAPAAVPADRAVEPAAPVTLSTS